MKLESDFTADQSALFQTSGAVFAVDQHTERLLFVSQNAHGFVGSTSFDTLLGTAVREILGREVTHALRNAESLPSLSRRRHHIGQFDLSGQMCDFSVFRTGAALVMEVLPVVGEREPTAYDVMKDVDVLTDALMMPGDRLGLLRRFVSLLRTMSGYHCVALDSGLGSRATTIAVAGREELAKAICEAPGQMHVLSDVSDPGLELAALPGVSLPDLGLSALHVPSEARLLELRAAGVGARATVGLHSGGEVWGNLKFLHATRRVPNKRTQFALAHLTPLIGQRIYNAA